MKPQPARIATSFLVPLAIVVLVAMATATVTSHQVESAGTRTASLATLQQGSLPQTVPLRRVAGHLMVDVTLDDAPPVPMLLDTGAPTSIPSSLAARVGAVPSTSVVVISPDGRLARKETVSVGALRLGPVIYRDVAAVLDAVASDSEIGSVAGHGIIGASLMAGAVWQIDAAAGRLTIARNVAELAHVDDAISLPFEHASASSPSPVVHIRIGSGRLAFLVDTGSDGGLAVHPADLVGLGLDVPASRLERRLLASVSGSQEADVMTVAASLHLGDHDLKPVTLYASEMLTPGMGLAGNAFLDDYILTIDWPAQMLYLDPTGNGSASRPAYPPKRVMSWSAGAKSSVRTTAPSMKSAMQRGVRRCGRGVRRSGPGVRPTGRAPPTGHE